MTAIPLPSTCDVLVVGAGPAGSACAQWLARAGMNVVLVDQHAFPRDKICGDGLIPDAHAALRKLGVAEEVAAQSQRVGHIGCVGPMGGRIDVPGSLSVIPRKQLDDILCRAAVAAGAALHAPLRFDAPLVEADRVVGARLKSAATTHEIRASWVVLATGAVPQAIIAAGLCQRRTPSGVALRGYVKNDAMVGVITEMEVVWHKSVRPGYGWIFPCRDGVFNIGVGASHSHAKMADGHAALPHVNLRELFDAFCAAYPPARALMDGGVLQGELKGAPLRCSLEGSAYTRAGLLATGEAIASTYAFTGEGIGKAMETGILAAEALLQGRDERLDDAQVRERYEATLLALKPRFDLYERANRINEHPWLADLLIWRAKRSARILRRMSGVLEETNNPGNLVSVKGIARLFLPIR